MGTKVAAYLLLILLVSILAFGPACTRPPDDGLLTGQVRSKPGPDSGQQGKPISVQTSDGVVILSCTVENDAQRTAVVRYVSEVLGVEQVANNLQMTPTPVLAVPAQNPTEQTPPPRTRFELRTKKTGSTSVGIGITGNRRTEDSSPKVQL